MLITKTPISAVFASPKGGIERDGRLENSSGGWIRTNGLRVMSPTSCHCSTPQWNEHYRPCSTKSQAQAEPASGIFCRDDHRPGLRSTSNDLC
jgi:hypothetical protein